MIISLLNNLQFFYQTGIAGLVYKHSCEYWITTDLLMIFLQHLQNISTPKRLKISIWNLDRLLPLL